jgi:hypothetical protein
VKKGKNEMHGRKKQKCKGKRIESEDETERSVGKK